MSDMASTSANALNVQQLFASLTGGSTGSSSVADPNLFGQNLPSDPASSTGNGTAATPQPATVGLTDQAKSRRDAAIAQSRLDLLGLQEQSGKSRGAKGAHAHHRRPDSAQSHATVHGAKALPATGVTGTANDDSTSGLSTLLLAQLAA